MHDLMAKGRNYGMQTFDQDLVRLLRDGAISEDVAMSAATSPGDLALQLRHGLDTAEEMAIERHSFSETTADDALLEVETHTLDEALPDLEKPES